MEQEIWKVYKETTHHGKKRVYEVSDQGNVKVNGELVDFSNQESYYIVGGFYVHRAVAELFISNPENKPCVDHINTNKHDNRAVNLRWCSHKENCNNQLTRKHNSEVNKVAQNRPEVKSKRNAAIKEAMNRPEVKAKQKAAMNTSEYRAKVSESSKDRSWLTNGINCKFVKPELVNYYLERGYHLGRK